MHQSKAMQRPDPKSFTESSTEGTPINAHAGNEQADDQPRQASRGHRRNNMTERTNRGRRRNMTERTAQQASPVHQSRVFSAPATTIVRSPDQCQVQDVQSMKVTEELQTGMRTGAGRSLSGARIRRQYTDASNRTHRRTGPGSRQRTNESRQLRPNEPLRAMSIIRSVSCFSI